MNIKDWLMIVIITVVFYCVYFAQHHLFTGGLPMVKELPVIHERIWGGQSMLTLSTSISGAWDILIAPFFILGLSLLITRGAKSKPVDGKEDMITDGFIAGTLWGILSLVFIPFIGLLPTIVCTLLLGLALMVRANHNNSTYFGTLHITAYAVSVGLFTGMLWSMPIGALFTVSAITLPLFITILIGFITAYGSKTVT